LLICALRSQILVLLSWKISNICLWSRTTPLIRSPCFSLPSISNSTRKSVWGKRNMNFDQLGNQWLDLWMLALGNQWLDLWMLAHVVAQIKTVGGGWHVSGCFLFCFLRAMTGVFVTLIKCRRHQRQNILVFLTIRHISLSVRWIWFSLFHK